MSLSWTQGIPNTSLGFFSHTETGVTDNTAHYCAITELGEGVTETDFQSTLPVSIRIIKIEVRITANTKSNNIDFVFRDDGVSVATLTVTGNNGAELVTSADLDVVIDSGSLINFLRDTSTSSSGTLSYKPLIFWYEIA